MPKSLTELFNLRRDTNLRNRVEVASDVWALQQASRAAGGGVTEENLEKFKGLAYDTMKDPVSTVDRLMRMVPLAADQQNLPLDNDLAVAGLVSALLDTYALARPSQ